MAGKAISEAVTASPPSVTPPEGAPGMSRDLLNSGRAQEGFDKARDNVSKKAKKQDADDATKEKATVEGSIRGDELFEAFNLENFLKEVESDAATFEKEVEEAQRFKKVREEGLGEEQLTKLEEIKKRVLERREAAVAGEKVATETPVKPVGTPAVPPATPPVTPANGGPIAPPVKPEGETPKPGEMPTQEQISKQIAEEIQKGLKPLQDKLTEKDTQINDLTEQLKKAEDVKKGIIEERDKLKQKTHFNRFQKAATEAGIPDDLHEDAMRKAQEIVDEAGKEMAYNDIFDVLRKKSPSLFNVKSGKQELEIRPGATGTGTPAGGSPKKETDLGTKKPADSFAEARSNLRKKLQGMT